MGEPTTKGKLLLYRYMRLGSFLNWVDTGQLVLSSPLTWDDHLESHWFDVLDSRGAPAQDYRSRLFGLCFSEEYFSEALWRRFGHCDDVVRVRFNATELKQAAEQWGQGEGRLVVFQTVRYGTSNQLATKALQLLSGESAEAHTAVPGLWLLKSKAFTFEKEWRVLVLTSSAMAGRTIELPADASSLVSNVLLDSRMNDGLSKYVISHLANVLPGIATEKTIVNRVPRALAALIPEAEHGFRRST